MTDSTEETSTPNVRVLRSRLTTLFDSGSPLGMPPGGGPPAVPPPPVPSSGPPSTPPPTLAKRPKSVYFNPIDRQEISIGSQRRQPLVVDDSHVAPPAASAGITAAASGIGVGTSGITSAAVGITAAATNTQQAPPAALEPSAQSTPHAELCLLCSESKGKDIALNFAPDTMVKDAVEQMCKALGSKSSDKIAYLKDSGIFMDPHRTLASYLLRNRDRVTLKSKEKKGATATVFMNDGADKEIVEIYADTTAWGVIQQLTKRPQTIAECEALAIFKGGERIAHDQKLSSGRLFSKNVSDMTLELKRASSVALEKSDKRDRRKTIKLPNNRSSADLQGQLQSSKENEPEPDKQKKMNILNLFLKARPPKEELVNRGVLKEVEPPPPPGSIPLKLEIFEQLCNFLNRDIKLVGLFRVSGGLAEVRSLYASFGNQGPLDLTPCFADPHIASSALKLYLREQRNPLIPFNMYSDFIRAMKSSDDSPVQAAALKPLVERMPEPNQRILRYLFGFLQVVARHSEDNKMTPSNLGIVFGPTIMWDQDASQMNFENTNVQSAMVAVMIEHHDDIFGANAFEASSAASSSAPSAPPASTPPVPPTTAPPVPPPGPPTTAPPVLPLGPPTTAPPVPPPGPPTTAPPTTLRVPPTTAPPTQPTSSVSNVSPRPVESETSEEQPTTPKSEPSAPPPSIPLPKVPPPPPPKRGHLPTVSFPETPEEIKVARMRMAAKSAAPPLLKNSESDVSVSSASSDSSETTEKKAKKAVTSLKKSVSATSVGEEGDAELEEQKSTKRRSKRKKNTDTADTGESPEEAPKKKKAREAEAQLKSILDELKTAETGEQKRQAAIRLLEQEALLATFAKGGGESVVELVLALTKAVAAGSS